MLCVVMDEMNLQCQAYHSGSLVGNDVHKLTKLKNISKISNVFKPISIQLSCGEFKGFSPNENSVKMRTLLTKSKQCYDLYTASRPLGRHEVALLGIRCSSLGCWFPVRYPNISVIPKFHVLTYHIPEKDYSMRTVGMEAEHASESIHGVINLQIGHVIQSRMSINVFN